MNGSIYHVFPADSKRVGTDQRQRRLLGIRSLTYCYLEDSARSRIKQIKWDERSLVSAEELRSDGERLWREVNSLRLRGFA